MIRLLENIHCNPLLKRSINFNKIRKEFVLDFFLQNSFTWCSRKKNEGGGEKKLLFSSCRQSYRKTMQFCGCFARERLLIIL